LSNFLRRPPVAQNPKPSPDAILKVALEILDATNGILSNARSPKLLRALAENYLAEALGGKPYVLISAIELQEAVKDDVRT